MSSNPKPRRLAFAAALVVATAGLTVGAPAQADPGHHRHRHHHGCRVTATDGFAQPIAALHCRSLAQYLADHMADRLPESLV